MPKGLNIAFYAAGAVLAAGAVVLWATKGEASELRTTLSTVGAIAVVALILVAFVATRVYRSADRSA